MSKSTPTLADVAAAAGVSAMTASRALNQQPGVSPTLRTVIVQLAAEMGYVGNRSAQRLASSRGAGGPAPSVGKRQVIGLLAPEPEHPFVGTLTAAAARAAAESGHELLSCPLTDPGRQSLDSLLALLRQSCDGLIALRPTQFGLNEALAGAGLPVVAVEQLHAPDPALPSVQADDYAGARLAMAHLLGSGHQRIALLGGDETLPGARERRRAWEDALAIAGLPRDPQLLLSADDSHRSGLAAAQRLLQLRERPTALLACHDLAALGLMAALQQAGWQLPQDLSLLGLDDHPASALFWPALGGVRPPLAAMGQAAVHALLTRMAGLPLASPQVQLTGELLPRDSCMPR